MEWHYYFLFQSMYSRANDLEVFKTEVKEYLEIVRLIFILVLFVFWADQRNANDTNTPVFSLLQKNMLIFFFDLATLFSHFSQNMIAFALGTSLRATDLFKGHLPCSFLKQFLTILCWQHCDCYYSNIWFQFI